jgi:sugar phosphate permease
MRPFKSRFIHTGPLIATWLAYNYHWSYGFMVPGCICMSMGYLAIIILRNEPADLRFVEVQNDDHNLQHLFEEDEAEENQEENENEDESENDTQSKIMMHLKKMKALCAHPFFLTICLAFFMMQFVKTLFSDWAQIYLIKSVKLDPYKGNFCFFFIFNLNT